MCYQHYRHWEFDKLIPECTIGGALGGEGQPLRSRSGPVLSAVPTLLTSLAICELPHRRWNMVNALGKALLDDEAQDIAEYAVMLAVILVLVVGTIRLVGSNANNVFSSVASSVQ